LRLLLAKLEPQRDEPAVTPYPAPRPSGEPSFVYAKLKAGDYDAELSHVPTGFAV